MIEAAGRRDELLETRGHGVVVLHDNDPDGYGAAWSISKALPEVTLFPVPHGRPHWGFVRKSFPNVADFDHVIVADLCFSRETTLSLLEKYQTITVLDHHMTAKRAVSDLPGAFIDTDYSAAMLAWMFFHGSDMIPTLIKYIQDYDLWTHELPYTSEIFSLIQSSMDNMTMGKMDELDFMLGDQLGDGGGFDRAVELGGVALKYRQTIANMSLQNVRRVMFDGHEVPCVNISTVQVISDVGHTLGNGEAFAVSWFQQSDGTYKYSLRSRFGIEPQALDVAEIATKHGGGGHTTSAGFISEERID